MEPKQRNNNPPSPRLRRIGGRFRGRRARHTDVPLMKHALSEASLPRGFRFAATACGLKKTGALDLAILSSAPVFFKPQAVAAKRNPRGKDASESACFISGTSVCLARRPRKRPPILRNRGEGGLVFCCLACVHGLAPVLVAFLLRRPSKSSMAARTLSGAVPPRTFFDASAASRLRLLAKSASNAGEIFLSVLRGKAVHATFCFSASRNTLPTMSCACRKGTPLCTR